MTFLLATALDETAHADEHTLRTVRPCFDRHSADFAKKKIMNWDVQLLFETVLARGVSLRMITVDGEAG